MEKTKELVCVIKGEEHLLAKYGKYEGHLTGYGWTGYFSNDLYADKDWK